MIKKYWSASFLIVLFILLSAVQPLARGRRGGARAAFRPGVRVAFFGVYGPRFYRGYGSSGFGYSGPLYLGSGYYGSVDFNVTPKQSQVYVDGALIGSADDFNGGFLGRTAKLPAGTHDIKIVAPDGTEIQRKIYVMPGRELNFNYRF